VNEWVERYCDQYIRLLQDLVRIPSVNHPPSGDEARVQAFYADVLRSIGLATDIFDFSEMPEFLNHPGRLADHDMANRPDVVGILKGTGGGRSLMVLAHADTVKTGDVGLWSNGDPFSGHQTNGVIYGRGVGDDKSGMAAAAIVAKILKENSVQLRGDLIVGSVSDEEEAGSNGTIGLIGKGYRADGCLYLDGTGMNLCRSNLGGGLCTITITVPGPVFSAARLLDYFDQLRGVLAQFKKERTQKMMSHPLYATDEFGANSTINITDVQMGVQDNRQGRFMVVFYLLPGEDAAEFKQRLETLLGEAGGPGAWQTCWISRCLEASEVPAGHPFVGCLAQSFQAATGRPGKITGMWMCDMGMVNKFGGFPCLAFGVQRWNTEGMVHQPDEYVEISELKKYLKTVLLCAMEWCGYS
jgi:acetylornithine deacetylase